VANYGSVASGLIGVEAPAFLLPFFNYFLDFLVMINLDTLVCFQNMNLNNYTSWKLFWFSKQSLKSYGAEFPRESASVTEKYQ
jgi:hypothetical protein